ncbi:G-protein coupled receptor 161-like [Centruroides sculpturatus]|uniref:G-protein coupled receptor 161-like n=1 Tax=Centruroides sculpturatus TaxID=218467 RepID=UPI000C6D8C47|nr:G-protein coupled receptor 161-like [Centruroides sculpturatus]
MITVDLQNATSSEISDKMEAVFLATLNAGSLIINSLVFLLFYRKPTLRTFSNRFVLSLSLCHMVQSVLQMPYVVLSGLFGRWIFGQLWCNISASLSICLCLITAFSLLLIAIDRCYAVNNPLHYTMTFNKKLNYLQIIGIWMISVILSLPPVLGLFRIEYRRSWHSCSILWYSSTPSLVIYSTVLTISGFLVPFIKLCLTYRSMYLAAKKNSARARMYPYRKKLSSFKLGEEWRAIRTPLMVVTSHVVSTLPFYLVLALESYSKRYVRPDWLMSIVNIALFSSSIINPYLYVFRNKTTKKELRKLVYGKKEEGWLMGE